MSCSTIDWILVIRPCSLNAQSDEEDNRRGTLCGTLSLKRHHVTLSRCSLPYISISGAIYSIFYLFSVN